jgi:hypothetical protein
MKTFYDLLDTDQSSEIDVVIGVSSITHNGTPCCVVSVNDRICYQGHLDQPVEITQRFRLLEPLRIKIEMSEKRYSLTAETAILIDRLSIDGFDIVPDYVHLARYENDQDQDTPTSYLGCNGIWYFDIDRPFYQWKHQNTGQGWLLTPATR